MVLEKWRKLQYIFLTNDKFEGWVKEISSSTSPVNKKKNESKIWD